MSSRPASLRKRFSSPPHSHTRRRQGTPAPSAAGSSITGAPAPHAPASPTSAAKSDSRPRPDGWGKPNGASWETENQLRHAARQLRRPAPQHLSAPATSPTRATGCCFHFHTPKTPSPRAPQARAPTGTPTAAAKREDSRVSAACAGAPIRRAASAAIRAQHYPLSPLRDETHRRVQARSFPKHRARFGRGK